jgi:hypothetical protein
MKRKYITLILSLWLVLAVLTVGVMSTLITTRNFGLTGNIVAAGGIQIYSDAGFTTVLTTVNFPNLSPNVSQSQTIYVRNEINTNLVLRISTSNWNPSTYAPPVIVVTWDKEASTLNQGIGTPATLTITPAVNAPMGNFIATITITGSDI